MTSISEAVHELVRAPRTWVTRDNGDREIVEVMSLLDQLEAAKTMRLNTGGGGGGSNAPVGCAAVDVEQGIVTTIQQFTPVHARQELASLPLPARVEVWARLVPQQTAYIWLTEWVAQIRGLFETVTYLRNAACPECGVSKVQVKKDGEWRQRDVLAVNLNTEVACCVACSAEWVGVDAWRKLAGMLRDVPA